MESKIYLCKGIKLDRDYNNVLNFQTTQFLNNVIIPSNPLSASNYNFIGKSDDINVAFSYEQCIECNYIAFQNSRYSNRWFFGWIDEVTYVNPSTVNIKWTIDAWTTFFGDWQLKPCMVLREHVNTSDDIVGNHTQPENLELGEYINRPIFFNSFNDYVYVILSTEPHRQDPDPAPQYTNINGAIFPGVAYVAQNAEQFKTLISYFDNSEAIYNCYLIPKVLIPTQYLTTTMRLLDMTEKWQTDWYLIKPNRLGNYIPKNKKLLTYPFTALTISNNQGSSCTYRYEKFLHDDQLPDNQMYFRIYGMAIPSGSITLLPLNYEIINKSFNNQYSLPCGKFPILPWSVDPYTNWITQNGNNLPIGFASDAINASLGLATFMSGNPVGLLAGANFLQSASQSFVGKITQMNTLSNTPPSARGNTNNGDISAQLGLIDYIAYEQYISEEYAKIIDDYFTRFGYKINRIKIPNLTGRSNYNYIEISQDSEIGYGVVPSNYMKIINDACRRGVTIWHNYSNFGDYSVNNI